MVTVVLKWLGEGENTSHGNRVDAPVTRLVDHPVHKGLPQSWIFADIEIYTYARGPAENLTVLSYVRDNKYQRNFPIEWGREIWQRQCIQCDNGSLLERSAAS